MKFNKGSTSTTVIIIVIVIVVILLVLGLVGCGVYYWWKNAQENSPVQTTTTQTSAQTQTSTTASTTPTTQVSESPDQIVLKYIKYTLGGIPGATIDYNAAKNLVSYELAQQLSDSSFVPLSYCIQNGPDDVKVSLDSNSGTVAYVTASANYGGTWDKMWEFEVVNGSNGWKIKYIKCLKTGQVTQ